MQIDEGEKKDKYTSNYSISASAIQPLVFEVYGGWATGTYEYLRVLVHSIAGGDDKLFASLWQDLRDRVAVTLATGQAAVIDYFNFKNGEAPWCATGPTSDGSSPTGTISITSAADATGLASSPSL